MGKHEDKEVDNFWKVSLKGGVDNLVQSVWLILKINIILAFPQLSMKGCSNFRK